MDHSRKLRDGGIPRNNAQPLELPDGRTVFVELFPGDHGYSGARVYDKLDRDRTAALAERTAREATSVGTNRVWEAAAFRVALDNAGLVGVVSPEALRQAVREYPELREHKARDFAGAVGLRHASGMLREARPDYDNMPDRNKTALLVGASKHQDEVLEAAKRLRQYVQDGGPDGLPKRKVKDVERDCRAAELRDALDWKHREISAELGEPLKGKYGDLPGVRRMVERGRKHLRELLGDGYSDHMERIRPELARYHSLHGDQRAQETLAEALIRRKRDADK